MFGKRLLQLIMHALLMMVCIVTIIISPSHHRFRWLDLLGTVIIVVIVLILWGSVKLNWQLIRLQKFSIKVPRTSWLHFAFIPLTIFIIYFAQLLRFYHDAHLSAYDLIAKIPDWAWLHIQNFNLVIVTTNLGVYAFLSYVSIISLSITIHLLGLFSNNGSIPDNVVISRPLLWSQITFGTLLVTLVLLFKYKLCRDIISLVVILDLYPDLLYASNIGRFFSDLVNIILLSLYGTWILFDGIQLWKTRRMPQTHS